MVSKINSQVIIIEFDAVWERVKELTGWTDYKDLAAFMGSSPQSVSGVKKRGRFPLDWARKIALTHDSFTDYIMDGVGPARRSYMEGKRRGISGVSEKNTLWNGVYAQGFETSGSEPEEAFLGKEYVLVPRYEVKASAGGGAIVHSEQIVDYLSFKADWIKNGLGLSQKDLALINVKGDSMEPTLSNEDLILVDLRTKYIEDNAIYVLQYNGSLLVKRVQRRLDGTVIVKGDNKVYEPEILTGDRAEMLNVIGRVVWCGRRL